MLAAGRGRARDRGEQQGPRGGTPRPRYADRLTSRERTRLNSRERLRFGAAPTRQLCEIRAINARPGAKQILRDFARNPTEAIRFARAFEARCADVYVGVLPRASRSGGANAVEHHNAIWLDLDYGRDGHAGTAGHPTRESALGAILNFPFEPTLVVASGGGFHVYFFLTRPVGRPVWLDYITRATAVAKSDPNVIDPPRILRVPGTHNRKLASLRPVRIESMGGPIDPKCFETLPRVVGAEQRREVLGPAPRAGSALLGRAIVSHRDLPFERAKDVPIGAVLTALGVELRVEAGRVYCACPVHRGSNPRQMVVGGSRNVARCFGDCGRSFTTVDIVRDVRSCTAVAAVNFLATEFGFAGFDSGKP